MKDRKNRYIMTCNIQIRPLHFTWLVVKNPTIKIENKKNEFILSITNEVSNTGQQKYILQMP